MPSKSSRPDVGHPYPPYEQLRAERDELRRELAWHREQLHAATTALTAVAALVADYGEVMERQGPPRGAWAADDEAGGR